MEEIQHQAEPCAAAYGLYVPAIVTESGVRLLTTQKPIKREG